MFQDRTDAAAQLARRLEPWRGAQPLVLGIARGAVPMAAQIARQLDTDWDVLLAKKLSAPHNPEFAIGAVDESGWMYRSDLIEKLWIDDSYLQQEKDRQMALMNQRREQYDAISPRVNPAGRTVIVVDDGLATGATMMAALHGLKQQAASKVICAVPIGARHTVAAINTVADEVICLSEPADFHAVSQGYKTFNQVEDSVILDLLKQKAASQSNEPT